jgi:hypothetical protein
MDEDTNYIVNWSVYRAVHGAVYRALHGTVLEAMYGAVEGAVDVTVDEDSNPPGLQDFLVNAKAEV